MSAELEAMTELVRRLVGDGDDPMTHSHEGLDDGCFFCAAWTDYTAPQPHFADCPWFDAIALLGIQQTDHVIDEDRARR